MKLLGTIKNLILETATIENLKDAIRRRKVVSIYYTGDEPGGNGLRTIEPVCLGISKAGNIILRAWDIEGASYSAYNGEQPLPGWRIFLFHKISSLNPTGEVYNEPRPNYNFDGDKSMTQVFINAKFDDLKNQNSV